MFPSMVRAATTREPSGDPPAERGQRPYVDFGGNFLIAGEIALRAPLDEAVKAGIFMIFSIFRDALRAKPP